MDAFIIIFLFTAAVIVLVTVFRYIGNKNKKVVASKIYYNHASNLFDYQNDPTDHRNLLNPGNPIGPNWVGENNLFQDRHNTDSNPEEQTSTTKNI